jgi:hypothetical protein
MPKISNVVLSTDREVKAAKSRGDRTAFRIKHAKNLVLRVSKSGTKIGPSAMPAHPRARSAHR